MSTDNIASGRISRKALVLPGLVPLAIAATFLTFAEHAGLTLGSAEYLVLLVWVWTAVAALAECLLVPRAINQMVRSPALRTPTNMLATAFGAVFALLVAAYILYGVLQGPP